MNQDIMDTKVDPKKVPKATLYWFQDIQFPQELQTLIDTSKQTTQYLLGVTNGLLDANMKITHDDQLDLLIQKGHSSGHQIDINKQVLAFGINLQPDVLDKLLGLIEISEEQTEKYIKLRDVELFNQFEVFKFKSESLYLISTDFNNFLIVRQSERHPITEINDVAVIVEELQKQYSDKDKREILMYLFMVLRNQNLLNEATLSQLEALDALLTPPEKQMTTLEKVEWDNWAKDYEGENLLKFPTYNEETASCDWNKMIDILKLA